MLPKRWFSWLSPPKARAAAPRRRPRLRLEVLEGRCVPAVFTVTSGGDSVGGGTGSGNSGDLRYCVAWADALHGVAADSDSIVFAAGVSAVGLTHGTLTLSDAHPLTIQGLPGGEAISGNQSFGIFAVSSGTVTFNGLSISQGGNVSLGGAISSTGTITLNNCTLENNSSTGAGGAVFAGSGAATLNGCTIDKNQSGNGGGIFSFAPPEDGQLYPGQQPGSRGGRRTLCCRIPDNPGELHDRP